MTVALSEDQSVDWVQRLAVGFMEMALSLRSFFGWSHNINVFYYFWSSGCALSQSRMLFDGFIMKPRCLNVILERIAMWESSIPAEGGHCRGGWWCSRSECCCCWWCGSKEIKVCLPVSKSKDLWLIMSTAWSRFWWRIQARHIVFKTQWTAWQPWLLVWRD